MNSNESTAVLYTVTYTLANGYLYTTPEMPEARFYTLSKALTDSGYSYMVERRTVTVPRPTRP